MFLRSLPEWAERALRPESPMRYIANLHFESYSATTELARLKPGFLIKDIMKRFTDKMNAMLQPDRKLWLYSAHDLTIINVLNAIGLYDVSVIGFFIHFYCHHFLSLTVFTFNQMHFPPYGASLHFELFKTHEEEYYFQIFYRQAEEEYPAALSIPGCGVKCTLKQFFDLYQDIIPGDDFEEECRHRV